MKVVKLLSIILIFFSLNSCKKDYDDYTYEFIQPYCTQITVGGIVGVTEKCYAKGDLIKGDKLKDGFVTIRIAEHSKLNDTPSDASYQEILKVPSINLKRVKKN